MLDVLESPRLYRSEFGFKSRFVGNYLSRALAENKIETDGFNRIVLVGCQQERRPNYIQDKVLVVDVPFDKSEYNGLSEDQLPEFFCKMYHSGIESMRPTFKIPYDVLIGSIESFRLGGYKNVWQAKIKLLKEISVKATVSCTMTMEFFSARLNLSRGREIFYDEEILNTLPDESFFGGQFRDITYSNYEVSVINRHGGRVYYLGWPIK